MSDVDCRADVAALLKILELHQMAEAEAVLARYYPLERYPDRGMFWKNCWNAEREG